MNPGWSAIAAAGLSVSEHADSMPVVWRVSTDVLPTFFAAVSYSSERIRVGALYHSVEFVENISYLDIQKKRMVFLQGYE
jgi:hypothetical protein